MGNYVIGVSNYVIAIRSTLGNSVIVHSQLRRARPRCVHRAAGGDRPGAGRRDLGGRGARLRDHGGRALSSGRVGVGGAVAQPSPAGRGRTWLHVRRGGRHFRVGQLLGQATQTRDRSPRSMFSGAMDDIDRFLGAHLLANDRVAVEDPCYTGVLNLPICDGSCASTRPTTISTGLTGRWTPRRR